MSTELHSVSDVLNGLDYLAENKEEVSLGDVLDEFGNRSFAPIMMILALMDLTPFGGIPGFPTVMAIGISLVALQLLVGREHIWFPRFLEKRSVSGSKLAKALDKIEGVAEKLDALSHSRFRFFAEGRALRVAAFLILLLCITVPPLEFVPFASTAPMIAIAGLSLAIMVRDGLAMLVASAASLGALTLGTYFYYTTDTAEVAHAVSHGIAALAAAGGA